MVAGVVVVVNRWVFVAVEGSGEMVERKLITSLDIDRNMVKSFQNG